MTGLVISDETNKGLRVEEEQKKKVSKMLSGVSSKLFHVTKLPVAALSQVASDTSMRSSTMDANAATWRRVCVKPENHTNMFTCIPNSYYSKIHNYWRVLTHIFWRPLNGVYS